MNAHVLTNKPHVAPIRASGVADYRRSNSQPKAKFCEDSGRIVLVDLKGNKKRERNEDLLQYPRAQAG